MERSDFEMPEFTRVIWASDEARDTWLPRIVAAAAAWREIAWLSVVEGIRPCATVSILPDDLVPLGDKIVSACLVALPIGFQGVQNYSYSNENLPDKSNLPRLLGMVVGSHRDALSFKSALKTEADPSSFGELLGYPSCCRQFFRHVLDEGLTDATWPMALASASSSAHNGPCVEIVCEPRTNVLWRWLGLQALPHIPCHAGCQNSVELATRFVEVGRKHGYGPELDWFLEILSWPVEWSAKYGIAEIKTPLLTMVTKTDYTQEKRTLRHLSDTYPKEGALGTAFPYRISDRQWLTNSTPYRDGLECVTLAGPLASDHDVELTRMEAWYHNDNGFRSRRDMNSAQRPLVELATSVMAGRPGQVLDLGCGNGLLLKKICSACPDAIPFGIDIEPEHIQHAGVLLPTYRDHFVAGNLRRVSLWTRPDVHYSLVIIGLCRLEELDPTQLIEFGQQIEQASDRILAYDYFGRELAKVVRSLGMHLLATSPDARAGLVKFGTPAEILAAQRLPLPGTPAA